MTLQDERKHYNNIFGKNCFEEEFVSLNEIEKNIADCKAMLTYALDRNDKAEISYWRKLLQENKVQRRVLNS